MDNKPHILLITTQACLNCVRAESVLNKAGMVFEKVVANNQPDVAERYGVMLAPTLVIDYGSYFENVVNLSNIIRYVEEHSVNEQEEPKGGEIV